MVNFNMETMRRLGQKLKHSARARKIWWWIFFSLSVLNGLCAITAGYAGIVNPYATAVPAMLALTFPLWIITTVVLFVVEICVSWRMALVPLLTLIICLGPILSNSPVNMVNPKVTDGNRGRTFTLLSFNIAQAYDMRDSVQHGKVEGDGRAPCNPSLTYLIGSDADIVCLQEFPKYINPMSWLRITQEQIDSLNRIYPHHTATWAESIFSKYPLYPIPFNHKEQEYEPYTAAMVDIQGHKTLLVSVHLKSFGLSDEDKAIYENVTEGEGRSSLKAARRALLPKLKTTFREHASQAREIRRLIDSLDIENVIVTGDFNDVPDCYAIRTIAGDDFSNSFNVAGRGPIITFHKNRFYFHIDHTLYRGNMEAIAFRRDDIEYSDHYPIITTFQWRHTALTDREKLPVIDLIGRDSTAGPIGPLPR